MNRKPVVSVFVVALLALTVIMGLARAQEAPDGPTVGACAAGAGYASGCDVDQDGDIDIADVQLTAGRWNTSGAYTSGHNHWDETWIGTGPHGLRLENTDASGTTSGLWGQSASTAGRGVYGLASASSGGATGVYGESGSTAGRGVSGRALAASGATSGVYGWSDSTAGRGVFGVAAASSGTNYGVYGLSNSPGGYAGYFDGQVQVTGNLSKGGGSFKIDHPLDPANQYLYHSFVESPDMMNIYNGNVTLDDKGEAVVTLPGWFEALNRDFRY